jgi:monoamine oxidase
VRGASARPVVRQSGPPDEPIPTSRRPTRVIVVGAGVAGLAAARALREHFVDVSVVEARDRVGGRVWTQDDVDLGAHWIHGTEGNPVATYALEHGLPTLYVGGDSTYTGGWHPLALFGPDGHSLSNEEKQEGLLFVDEVRDTLESLRREIAASGGVDVSIADAVARVLADRELTPKQRTHLEWHLRLLSRDDWAAGAENLSLLSWDDGYEVYGYGDSVFIDGMQPFVESLASDLDIRLNHVVERIEHGSDGVRVFTSQGMLVGDVAIVTLPVGVLRAGAVTFDPPLPERKRQAIERIGVGTLAKLVLRFPAPFWPKNQYVFGCVSEASDGEPTVVVNLWKTHRIPVLLLSVGGALGSQLESWTEHETRAFAARIVRRLFGEAASEPVSVVVTRWSADPFARGAYSYMAVGSTPADLDALAAPVNKCLFFAGEATVRSHWACVHGAYVSGLREAARLTGDFRILPARHFTENRRWRDMLQRADRFLNLVNRHVDADEVDFRFSVLGRSAVFASVPSPDLRILATMFEPQWYSDGETICTAGEPATRMYAVAEGEIEVRLPGIEGAVATMSVADVVGEYGMFRQEGRTATLVAKGSTLVLVLDYQRFKRFLLAFPESLMALMALTVGRLQSSQSGAE